MPVFPCAHGFCPNHVQKRGQYCPEHAKAKGAKSIRAEGQREYDKNRRDKESDAFYHSPGWRRARAIQLREYPVCRRCGHDWSKHVHHERSLKEAPELALVQSNLRAVCNACHSEIEAERRSGKEM